MKKINIYETAGKLGKIFRDYGVTALFAAVYGGTLYLCYLLIASILKIKKNVSKILNIIERRFEC